MPLYVTFIVAFLALLGFVLFFSYIYFYKQTVRVGIFPAG